MVKEKLRQAAAFCQSEGAHSVKDIRDFKLVDEFLQALEPLRRVPRAKLTDALKPSKTTGVDSAVPPRHYTSTDKMPGEGNLVKGKGVDSVYPLRRMRLVLGCSTASHGTVSSSTPARAKRPGSFHHADMPNTQVRPLADTRRRLLRCPLRGASRSRQPERRRWRCAHSARARHELWRIPLSRASLRFRCFFPWCAAKRARVTLPCRGAACTRTVPVLPRRRARHG